jgi:hypothetical protein
MALSRTIITLLAQLRYAQLLPNYARVVEIGAQQLNNNFLSTKDDLSVLGQLFGIQGLPGII